MLIEFDVADNIIAEKQLPIGEESKQALIEIRINLFYDESDLLATKMYIGEISLGQWEESMKKAIRELHTAVLAITKGGWENVTYQEWGRLGTPLREQYAFLHNFAQNISDNRDTMSLKMIQARSRLYGKAAWNTVYLFQAGPVLEKLLPWIPRDGSTQCLIGCMCRWEFQILSKNETTTKIRAVWKLCDAEHCPDCIGRKNHVEIIDVSSDVEIPEIVGMKC